MIRVCLLLRDQDFDWDAKPPWNADALAADLGLDHVLEAMAKGDDLVLESSRRVLLGGLQADLATLQRRQAAVGEALAKPNVVRELYELGLAAAAIDRKHYLGGLRRYPDWVLKYAVDLLADFLALLQRLHRLADAQGAEFRSEAWRTFFSRLNEDLGEAYLARVGEHLAGLRFSDGLLMSARLGAGAEGADYQLHRTIKRKTSWWARLVAYLRPPPERRLAAGPEGPVWRFSLDPRDVAGHEALRVLQNRAISSPAAALGEAAEHVRRFFEELRREMAFLVGCLNLRDALAELGAPISLPVARPPAARVWRAVGLYDPALALQLKDRPVGNAFDARDRGLLIVTGANRGGKSTLLRSLGLAQVMMQAGMFVAGEAFEANLAEGVFTLFKRGEDPAMRSGKLDEELVRMSEIVDHLRPDALVLFNEAFAATNEREGSEIARHVTLALSDSGVKVGFVTHLYDFAQSVFQHQPERAFFLAAPRQSGPGPRFKLEPRPPSPTSFGPDLYAQIFGDAHA